jgi:preprotein translocase subunit SecY
VILLRNFINIFHISELRKKLLFTLGILIVYRIGGHIPVIGINVEALQRMIEQSSRLGGIFQYLDLFSGGMLRQCTLFALGVMPYITASITMQMLGMAVPSLEQLLKEGEYGRKLVNQYTRYLSIAVSLIQGTTLAFFLERNNLVLDPGWGFRIIFLLSLTAGSCIVMWLGEQISLFGIGNGSSMIIFAGIVAGFPSHILRTWHQVQEGIMDPVIALAILALLIAIMACIVFLEKGQRKIPVQYTRRIVGARIYGGQSSYIPFKINIANIMPVIFAGAVLNVPMFVSSMLASYVPSLQWVADTFTPMGIGYNVLEFALIICFSFFYIAVMLNPQELADNLKKSGGFIPGKRPGNQTAEYFNYILTRIGFVGALYLAVLAISPNLARIFINMPFYIGGTSLLIVVGVALETAAQVESYLIEHRYEGFLSRGRMRSVGGR